ncbi:MAG TPA: three-Cys-motif partner protein TcmP [Ktedonobacteraceae bacterium]|jgi:three-Cys-motif partner protein|nr:three-Cys-motif partner protein TcmP [Ktedonobacteraceae bacterium]
MSGNQFFDEMTEQSLVKTAIVSKYFWAWAKVIIPTAKKYGGKIAYIDLFAGPGRYKDGTKSTPLLVLEKAIEDKDMREMLVTIFNDVDKDNSRSLENAIKALSGIDSLKYAPCVYAREIGEEIVKMFEQMSLIPTLFFVDPWGYKGLSLRLVNSVLKDWGCDCIFFFNYNRINMGLPNQIVDQHMDALFGQKRARDLRKRLELLSPYERELVGRPYIKKNYKEVLSKMEIERKITADPPAAKRKKGTFGDKVMITFPARSK